MQDDTNSYAVFLTIPLSSTISVPNVFLPIPLSSAICVPNVVWGKQG